MRCYVVSPDHPARTLAGTEASRRKRLRLPDNERYNRDRRNCLECEKAFEVIPSKSKKFCSTACYRIYMTKRFDRWIAAPQRIALPQAYDEFLVSDELPCLVDGCEWVGKNLSCHMNYTHGVPAEEFKRAAGFNLSTGVVSLPTHQTLVNRAVDYRGFGLAALAAIPSEVRLEAARRTRRYRSKEGMEHYNKVRSMAGIGPDRLCLGCGIWFVQSTPFGRTLFCSPECRDGTYATRKASQCHNVICAQCSRAFLGSSYQFASSSAGRDVFCSRSCSGHRNGRLRRRNPSLTDTSFAGKAAVTCSGRRCVYRSKILQDLWPVHKATCSMRRPASNISEHA